MSRRAATAGFARAPSAPSASSARATVPAQLDMRSSAATRSAHEGSPLDTSTRGDMEQRFGRDFAGVRLHTDAVSASSARHVGAHAYAVGNDIFFDTGAYEPATPRGRFVLAHELAHVAQQDGAAPLDTPEGVPFASQAEEQNAHAVARAALNGGRPEPVLAVGRPRLARLTREEVYRPRTGHSVRVEQRVTPGRCRLTSEPEFAHQEGIDLTHGFLAFQTCRGTPRVTGEGSVEYGDVLTGAAEALGRFIGDPSAAGGDRLRSDLLALEPRAQVALGLDLGSFVIEIAGEGAVRLGGDAWSASGGPRLRIPVGGDQELVIGPVVSGGSDGDTRVTIEGRLQGRTERPPCRTCRCTRPRVSYHCFEQSDRTAPPPPARTAPVSIPIQFEYSTITPSATTPDRVAAIRRYVEQGYRITSIVGNASPEGPEHQDRPGRRAPPGEYQFLDNTHLAADRATTARQLIEAALQARAEGAPTATDTSPLLDRSGLAAARVEGQGELFGSANGQEVARDALFAHLQTELQTPVPGQSLEQAGVLGASLPEDIRAANQAEYAAFSSGVRGQRTLSQTERLDALYPLLRRALVTLTPPPIDIMALTRASIDRQIIERAMEPEIHCRPEHRRLFSPLTREQLFDGECREERR